MSRPDPTQKLAATAPRSTNRILIGGLIALVSVAIVIALLFIGIGKSSTNSPAGGATPATPGATPAVASQAVPKGALGFGQAMVVNPDATGVPTLDVYEDPQCPVVQAVRSNLRARRSPSSSKTNAGRSSSSTR
ncbi:MAG: hypothetical protein V9F04_04375 [Dermatophilaceae bacterium]